MEINDKLIYKKYVVNKFWRWITSGIAVSFGVEKPFVIYRSSAGSGKTYTLAREYLKLSLRYPQAYRNILAVTFTNKATQEMKGRVLQYLHEVAKADSSPLRKGLAEELDLPDLELSLKAENVLQNLLHGYSHFSVMTIDSFFQKVVRGFAREMGLQAGFRVELDIDRVLDEVIDQLLLDIGETQHKEIRRWLTHFAEEKVESGKSWDFRREIKELAKELFKENYREEHDQTVDLQTRSVAELLKQLREMQQAFEQHMASIGQAALELMNQRQADVSDFAYGSSGVAGYFTKISEGNSFLPTSRVLQASDSLESWVSKKNPDRKRLLSVASQLLPQLEQALEAYDEYGTLYQSAVQMQRFVYAYGILHHLESEIDSHKRENDLMLISDAPVFLQEIIGKDDTPFIYEKIGSYYRHFLIDEFQDTSGLQWMNFRPLVENSLDAGNENLVVGDVKQSIYRWRGGDWQLLLNTIQQDMQEWRTDIRQLDHNFRSHRNVLAFNNALFQTAPEVLFQHITAGLDSLTDEVLRQQLLQQSEVLRQAYQDVTQKLPATYDLQADWQGHVRIELLEEDHCLDEEGEPTDWKSYVQTRLPRMVEKLQSEGYAAKDIAFLVRNKRDGQAVVDTFMQYKQEEKNQAAYNYEIVSSESLVLTSALSVRLLVDLMRFLDNDQDEIVRSSILHKYYQLTTGESSSDELHTIFSNEDDDELSNFFQQLPADFAKYYAYLNKLPVYELVENLVLIFDLGQYNERAYLQAFQDAVLQYSLTERGDLRSFLIWWDERGANNSAQISEETDAMRVMTIHKAKGLQFKVVIVPFCDWELDHQPLKTNILWASPQNPELANVGLVPMKYSSQLTQTVFSREYYEEKIRIHMDHLNLLYVAFTRAEEGLYAFARPKAKGKSYSVNGIANLLYNILPELEIEGANSLAGWDEMGRVFEVGERKMEHGERKIENKKHHIALPEYSSVRWRNRLSVRPLSRGFFSTGVGQVSQVVLMQQLLVQLPSADQLHSQLEKIAFEQGLTSYERQKLKEQASIFLAEGKPLEWYKPSGKKLIQRPILMAKKRSVVLDRVVQDEEKVIAINFYTHLDEPEKVEALFLAKDYLLNHYKEVDLYLVNVNQLEVRRVL
ncbi:MAG: UvrD-helicase domain-containing protein [Bacteroidota bacterium]